MRLSSTTIQRTLSLLIVIAHSSYTFLFQPDLPGRRYDFRITIAVLAALLIWFPDYISRNYNNFNARSKITKVAYPPPPGLIRGIGWLVLITVPSLLLLISLSS